MCVSSHTQDTARHEPLLEVALNVHGAAGLECHRKINLESDCVQEAVHRCHVGSLEHKALRTLWDLRRGKNKKERAKKERVKE